MRRLRVPILPLQSVVFARIKADYPARDVYVYVPGQNKLPPFITIGATSSVTAMDLKGEDVLEVSMQIHCWSQTTGNAEVIGLVNEVLNAITRTDLDLSADRFSVFDVNLDRVDISAESGDEIGIVQHGIVSLKFIVEDLSQY